MKKLPAKRFPLALRALSLTLSITTLLLGLDFTSFAKDAQALTCQEQFLFGYTDPNCSDGPQGGSPSMTVSPDGAASASEVEVEQQSALQDLEGMNFSLKTQDGDILKYANNVLKEVERPDGTILENITLGSDGTIQDADLKLADGSLQIFENGKVVGYTTPDGTQIQYENDLIKKTIAKDATETLYSYIKDSAGKVTQTTLESSKAKAVYDANNRLKETLDKITGTKNYYTNGILLKIVKSDNSQYIFTATPKDTDTEIALTSYINAQGVTFTIAHGATTLITFTNGSKLSQIIWGADNKVSGGVLTLSDSSVYTYAADKLTRYVSPTGVVTTYTYTSTTTTALTGGVQYLYNTDKNLTRTIAADGTITSFSTSGDFKGYKKDEVGPTGTFMYTYTKSSTNVITATKKKLVTPAIAETTLQGSAAIAVTANPTFKTTVKFAADGTSAQQGIFTATASGKALNLKLVPDGTSTWTFNGVTTNLSVAVVKDTTYKVEVNWLSDKIAIFVYKSNATKPTTPTVSIADRAWSPTFKAVTQNATLALTTGSSGTYTTTTKNIAATYQELGSVAPGTRAALLTAQADYLKTLTLTNPQTLVQGTASFKTALYDTHKVLKEAVLWDNSELAFTGGVLSKASDSNGNLLTSFAFDQSSLGNLMNTTLTQGQVTSTYDEEGNLASTKVGDQTIHYQNNTVDYVQNADGTRLSQLKYDSATGSIKDAVITTPDGQIREYTNGQLTHMEDSDNTEYFFLDEKLLKIITPEKITYNFTYTPTEIKAEIDPATVVGSKTPVSMVYDSSFSLKKIIKQNNEIFSYSNNELVEIISPSKAPKSIVYTKDASGQVLSYKIIQSNTQTFFDANHNLLKAVVSPTADNPHTFEIQYQYSKIRQILKNGLTAYLYDYAFDAQGKETVTVKGVQADNSEKVTSVSHYEGDLLLNSLDTETNVLQTYSYDNAKIKSQTLTRFGRTLHTYSYTYSGDHTIVTDDENTIRTYNDTQDLLFLERDKQKFSYTYVTNPDGEKITKERLVQKILSDGSKALYDGGNVSDILLTTGELIRDIVLNPDGSFKEASLYAADGSKKVFNSSGLVEQIDSDGTRNVYKDGLLSQVIATNAQTLDYSYVKNTNDSLQAIRMKTGDAALQYSPAGDLLGLKLNAMTPQEVTQVTQHAYEGPGEGPLSIDGNYNTAQGGSASRSFGQTQGNVSVVNYSTHSFPEPQTITSLSYRFNTSGSGSGAYGGHGGGHSIIEYQTSVGGPWIGISQTESWMGDTGPATKSVDLTGVVGLRALASGYGEGSDQGSCSAAAYIHEFQWTLADKSWLNYSKTTDTGGAVTGYRFDGSAGSVVFDSASRLTQASSNLTLPAQSLNSKIASLTRLPLFSKINTPAFNTAWAAAAKSSILDASSVTASEYSSTGVLETQTKSDGTVTLFEKDKPSKVLSASGEVLIEYTYDASGNIQKVFLKNARETLPKEMIKARESIESQRAASLLELAKQKNLAYQSIESQVDVNRQTLQGQLGSLQNQYNSVASIDVSGKKAKNQRGDALNSIAHAMDDVRIALTTIERQAADAYAALNSQVKQLSDQITSDSVQAFVELDKQEAALKKEIIRQEISPVVYDHYRRILGRDPSGTEYDAWISKVMYESGAGSGEILVSGTTSVTSTLLNTTYGTAARSVRSDGTQSWRENASEGSLFTYWGGSWVEYNATLSAQGSLTVSLDGKNLGSAGIPATYTNFLVDVYIDGVKKGTMLVPASMTTYQKGTFTIAGVSQGTHKIRLTWTNDNAGSPYDSNLQFRNVVIQHAYTQTAGVTLTASLTQTLNALPELAERKVYVQNIKNKVTAKINSFLAKSAADKAAFAASLGLASSDIVPLSSADAQKILSWLGSRSLHFGQSAFLSLESLLDQNGKTYAREDIAEKSILIDILTGVISPLDDGDLVISMYALNKVASFYGVTLAGANLSWDDLKAIYGSQQAAATEITRVSTAPGSSVDFTGNGDPSYNDPHLVVSDSDALDLGAGDYTVETWIKLDSIGTHNMPLSRNHNTGQGDYELSYSALGSLTWGTNGQITRRENVAIAVGTWTHIAVTRSAGKVKLFVNGKELGTAVTNTSDITGSGGLSVGSDVAGNWGMDGRMDGLRISKVARYGTAFTASRERFVSDTNTRLLLYTDAGTYKDFSSTSHTLVTTGTVGTHTDYAQTTQATGKKTVAALAQEFQFKTDGTADYSENWAGLHEKWFMGKLHEGGDVYYYIMPDGNIYASRSTSTQASMALNGASGDILIAKTSPEFYLDPSLIINAPISTKKQMIAHISGNHYVVITDVKQDVITYMDPGAGVDKKNEIVTASKDQFLKAWKGNVLAEKSTVDSIVQKPNTTARTLTAQETQKIRGSFFLFLIPIAVAIFSGVGAAIGAIAATIGAIVAGIGVLVGGIIATVGSVVAAIGSFIGSLATTLFTGIQAGFMSLFGGMGGALAGSSGGLLGGFGGGLFGGSFLQNAVAIGLNLAATKGLEVLGVDPTIAGYLTAFATGGIMGGLADGFTFGTFMQSGIGALATLGIQDSLVHFGVSPLLASALSGLSNFSADGYFHANFGDTILKIAPDIAGVAAQYGISKLGDKFGWSPYLTSFVGSVGSSLAVNISHSMINQLNTALIAGRQIGQEVDITIKDVETAADQISSAIFDDIDLTIQTNPEYEIVDSQGKVTGAGRVDMFHAEVQVTRDLGSGTMKTSVNLSVVDASRDFSFKVGDTNVTVSPEFKVNTLQLGAKIQNLVPSMSALYATIEAGLKNVIDFNEGGKLIFNISGSIGSFGRSAKVALDPQANQVEFKAAYGVGGGVSVEYVKGYQKPIE